MLFYRVLELAVAHDPVRYRDLIVDPRPKRVRPRHPEAADTRQAWTAPSRTTLASP